MKTKDVNQYIIKHWTKLSDDQLAIKCGISLSAILNRRYKLGLKRNTLDKTTHDPQLLIAYQEREEAKKQEKKASKRTIQFLLTENARLKKERDASLLLHAPLEPRPITRSKHTGGEATMIALASDWHMEERLRPAEVNGFNQYNLDIADKRANHYFTTVLRLVQIEQQNTRVETLVLALLGDFITGDIHDELVEICQLEPAVAARFAQERIVTGIEHILHNSKLQIQCIAHSGNHARTTKEQRHATEHGHSLEWMIYKAMQDHYEGHSRVKFIVPEGYHSYLPVYGKMIRFHHGHAINYGGGVGGITIPVRKAIAQWNTLKRADVDCFGHFHQAQDGGSFVANGAMIGYNAYALSIKAEFQEPSQMLFGIHSKLGKYITRQIKFIFD